VAPARLVDILELTGQGEVAEQHIELALDPLASPAGRVGAETQEPCKAGELPQQLERMALPVGKHLAPGARQVGAELRLLTVLRRVSREGQPAEPPVEHGGDDKKRDGNPRVGSSRHGATLACFPGFCLQYIDIQ